MLCSRKILVFTGCAVVVCAGLFATTASGKNDKDKEKDKAKVAQPSKPGKKDDGKKSDGKKPDDRSAEGGEKQPSKLVIPLPKGQDSKGVTIPIPDASGKKNMVFKIGVGTRVDDDHVKMSDLFIETFSETGDKEMTVTLPGATLDLGTRTIAGNQSVTINRSDFQITGQTMEFNTESRKGWIKGDVKMIIYDLAKEATETPGAPAAPSPNQNPSGS